MRQCGTLAGLPHNRTASNRTPPTPFPFRSPARRWPTPIDREPHWLPLPLFLTNTTYQVPKLRQHGAVAAADVQDPPASGGKDTTAEGAGRDFTSLVKRLLQGPREEKKALENDG